jgi:hypothetical protein
MIDFVTGAIAGAFITFLIMALLIAGDDSK